MWSMPRRRLVLWLLPLPLCFVAGIGWSLNQWGKRDRAQRADAIVVFGARVYSGGEASPILHGRTRHAYDLWKRGLAPVIVCTGGIGKYPPAEAVVSRQLLEGWGVPAKAIRIDDKSTSTRENAHNAAALLPPSASVIGVSEPFHLWRCRRDCANYGLKLYTSPETSGWNQLSFHSKVFYCIREAVLVTRDVLFSAFSGG